MTNLFRNSDMPNSSHYWKITHGSIMFVAFAYRKGCLLNLQMSHWGGDTHNKTHA